jgi:hypothetical protein
MLHYIYCLLSLVRINSFAEQACPDLNSVTARFLMSEGTTASLIFLTFPKSVQSNAGKVSLSLCLSN